MNEFQTRSQTREQHVEKLEVLFKPSLIEEPEKGKDAAEAAGARVALEEDPVRPEQEKGAGGFRFYRRK